MKKTILVMAVALFTSVAASAQSGSLWLGGDLGFRTQKNSHDYKDINSGDDDKYMQFTIAPHVEYFLGDDMSVLVGLSYGLDKHTVIGQEYPPYGDNDKADHIMKTSGFGFNLGVRKYFSINDKFSFYCGAHFGINAGKESEEWYSDWDDKYENKISTWNLFIYPGISYKVADNVVIYSQFGLLGYHHKTTKLDGNKDNKDKEGVFSFGINNDPCFSSDFSSFEGIRFGFVSKIM